MSKFDDFLKMQAAYVGDWRADRFVGLPSGKTAVIKEPGPLTWKYEAPTYGTGIVRPHAFEILPARHVDVLHRDGWPARTSSASRSRSKLT